MYYLFGIGENVFVRVEGDEDWPLEKEKATLVLEEFPESLEDVEGKNRILFIDPETLEAKFIYKDIDIFEEIEE